MDINLTLDEYERELAVLVDAIGKNTDDITTKEQAELTEVDEDDRQEYERICKDEVKNKVKKDKTKEDFVPLLKADFDTLNRREQFEYKIRLAKFKTGELKKEYEDYKTQQSKAARSAETRKLIIMGRFLDAQFQREDRKVQYLIVKNHLDQYLTHDRDRKLLGFTPLSKSDGDDNS